MSELNCKLHLIFVPDEKGYADLGEDTSRRAEIMLEMMDELNLAVKGKPGFPGSFPDTAIKSVDGKFDEDDLDEKLRPLILEYNGQWRNWQIEEQGRSGSSVGNIQIVSTALQNGVYYYSELGNPNGWCRRGFAIELVEATGEVVPFRISRPIDLDDPDAGSLYAEVHLTLTHIPHQP